MDRISFSLATNRCLMSWRSPRNKARVLFTSWSLFTVFRSVTGGEPRNCNIVTIVNFVHKKCNNNKWLKRKVTFIASILKPWLHVELCSSLNCIYRNFVTACKFRSSGFGALGSTAIIYEKIKIRYLYNMSNKTLSFPTLRYKSCRAEVFLTSDSKNVRVPIFMSITLGSLKPYNRS